MENELGAQITDELMENKMTKVTFKQSGMNRVELSVFIDSYLSECTRNWVGGNIYADPTIDGYVIYEY